jgi:ribosome-binding protein aMBF1 (putative translation factor)
MFQNIRTIPFEEVKEEVLKDPEVKAHYVLSLVLVNAPISRSGYEHNGQTYVLLEEKYALIEALIRARASAGLSQEEIASRMGTTQAAIERLEGGSTFPSLKTLYKYAKAAGVKPVISFEPLSEKPA